MHYSRYDIAGSYLRKLPCHPFKQEYEVADNIFIYYGGIEMNRLRGLLLHIGVICSFVCIAAKVLDWYNPYMDFT